MNIILSQTAICIWQNRISLSPQLSLELGLVIVLLKSFRDLLPIHPRCQILRTEYIDHNPIAHIFIAGESATSVYYPVEPLRSQTISPDNLRSTRFNSTLREIISSDYMIEIKKLQRRIDKLELKLSYSLDRDSTPVIQYIGGLDDDRIDRILQRMDSMKTEINRKLRDMDEELYTVLEHGVGVSRISPVYGRYYC